jgi:hypothetical protein
VRWAPARESIVLRMLRNPIYAGAYVFGRHDVDGTQSPS